MVSNPGAASEEVQVAISARDEFSGPVNEMTTSLGALNKKTMAVAAGGVAALAGALGGKSVAAAADFEAAMADVQKVTDQETAAELSDDIQELSEEIPLATDELADLAAQAGRFGAEGAEEIRDFTEVAAEMGAATTLAADEAGRSLAKLSEAVGSPLSEVRTLGDAINELSNNFATNSQEIVDAAQRSGIALRTLGASENEILGLATAINETSVSSRRAGNALRQLGEAFGDTNTIREMANDLRETGELTRLLDDDMGGLQRQLEEQETSVHNANSALRREQEELRKLQTELRETDGELESLGEEHDELGDKISENRIQIQEIRVQARREGRDLTEEEKEQIDELQLKNDELRLQQDKLKREMDETREAREDQVEQVEEQKATIEEQQDVVESEKEQLADLSAELLNTAAEEETADTMLGIAEAMEQNEELSDRLADTLSTQQLRALEKVGSNTDSVREAMETSNDAMEEGGSLAREVSIETDTLQGQFELLKSEIDNVFVGIGENLVPVTGELIDGFSNLVDAGSEVGEDILPELTDGVGEGIDTFDDFVDSNEGIQDALEDTEEVVDSTAGAALSAVRGDYSGAMDQLERAADSATDGFKNALVGPGGGGGIIETLRTTVNDGQRWLQSEGGDVIREGMVGLGEAAVDGVDDLSTILVGPDGESGALSAMVDQGAEFLRDTAPELFGEAMQAIGTGIRRGLIDLTNPLRGEDSEIWDLLADGATWLVTNLPDLFFAVGEGIVDAITEGVKGLFEGLVGNSVLKDQISDAGDWLVENAASLVGGVGSAIVDGIVGGIKDVAGDLKSALLNPIDTAVGTINDVLPAAIDVPEIGPFGGGSVSTGRAGDVPGVPDKVKAPEFGPYGGGEVDVPGVPLEGLDTGGFIKEQMPAMLHAGERVLPESQVSERGEASFDPDSVARGFDNSAVAQDINGQLSALQQAMVRLAEEIDPATRSDVRDIMKEEARRSRL